MIEQEYIPYSPPQPHPISRVVAQILERDGVERARIFIEIDRRREAGEDVAQDETGINWRRFAVDFAAQNPRLTMFAPFAALIYVYLFFQLIFGS